MQNVLIRLIVAAALAVAATPSAATAGFTLVGTSFTGPPTLYDVSTATGAATNPRTTDLGFLSVGGLAYSPASGLLYGLGNFGPGNSSAPLFAINPVTGAAVTVGGGTGFQFVEGDLAYDPTADALYGIQSVTGGPSGLVRIDPTTGVGTRVGTIGNGFGDYSAGAFTADGTLYTVTASGFGEPSLLQTIDKANGAILTSVALSAPLSGTLGLAINPETGLAYLAGVGGGVSTLYTVDLSNGQLATVGRTGLATFDFGGGPTGLAGLAFVPSPVVVPAPATALVLVAAAAGLGALRRRRIV